MSSNDWDKVGISSGLLTDEDIALLGRRNLLISNGYDDSQVKQTCYELRVGNVAYFLSRPDSERKKKIDKEHPLIVRQQEVVTIITYEEVSLPEFILGRIVSKGHLFSIGLSPVITYVDPGFSGNLGITFINLSKRSIKFDYKDTICKIEFEKLGKGVRQPYRGPHNLAAEIWPIDASKFLPLRKIEPGAAKNDRLLREDAEYFGEPFDLISQRLAYIGNQIRWLKLAVAGVVAVISGTGVFLLVQRILIPESILAAIASATVTGLFTLLIAILKYGIFRKEK